MKIFFIYFFALIALSASAQFKVENPEIKNQPVDENRRAELAPVAKDQKELRLYLMNQENSIQARELATKANKWRKAGNAMWIGMGASVVAGAVMMGTAESQEILAGGLVLLIAGGGFFYYMANGFTAWANALLLDASNIYLRPYFDQKTTAGLSFSFRF